MITNESTKKYFFDTVCIGFFFNSFCKRTKTFFLQWNSTNIQLLRGYDYEVGSEDRTLLTLEHASGWQYGDVFGFLDQTWPEEGNNSYYVEISPRVSINKLRNKFDSKGLIKDVLISTTIEKPENSNARYLYGFAIDFNISGFKFFKTNLYIRNNPALERTYQVTLSWSRPFRVKRIDYLIEGFADLAGDEGQNKKPYQLIVPRFLVDIGSVVNLKKKKLFLGIEWQYWHNKFGIQGVTESVPQFQIKYNF